MKQMNEWTSNLIPSSGGVSFYHFYIVIQNCISNPEEPLRLQIGGGGQNHSGPVPVALSKPRTLLYPQKGFDQVSVY